MFRSSWLDSAAVYLDRRILAVLFLGFSSGLPLALTAGTLSIWLSEGGVSKTAIGLFSLVGLPYTLKFAWAPLIDRLRLPWVSRRFGRRRGWALVTQGALMASLFGMASANPATDPWWTALFAVLVAFCSASQDIVLDAYRVEVLERDQLGAGAAVFVLGYRLGMLAAGAGALFLAEAMPWAMVYQVMAGLVAVGMATVVLSREPAAPIIPAGGEAAVAAALARRRHLAGWQARLIGWLYGAVAAPFAQFMARRGWLVILLFISLYKLGDVLAGIMAGPFYLELGFAKSEIASVTKVFGLIATIVGGLLGGIVVSRLGILRALFVCGIAQMGTNLMFAALAWTGHSLPMLMVVIGVENLAGGMATAAFVAYLSGLCNVAYTATQYALLTSFAGIGRDFLGASAGWFADQLDWVSYFLLTTVAALPGLMVLVWLARRYPVKTPEGASGGTPGVVAAD